MSEPADQLKKRLLEKTKGKPLLLKKKKDRDDEEPIMDQLEQNGKKSRHNSPILKLDNSPNDMKLENINADDEQVESNKAISKSLLPYKLADNIQNKQAILSTIVESNEEDDNNGDMKSPLNNTAIKRIEGGLTTNISVISPGTIDYLYKHDTIVEIHNHPEIMNTPNATRSGLIYGIEGEYYFRENKESKKLNFNEDMSEINHHEICELEDRYPKGNMIQEPNKLEETNKQNEIPSTIIGKTTPEEPNINDNSYINNNNSPKINPLKDSNFINGSELVRESEKIKDNNVLAESKGTISTINPFLNATFQDNINKPLIINPNSFGVNLVSVLNDSRGSGSSQNPFAKSTNIVINEDKSKMNKDSEKKSSVDIKSPLINIKSSETVNPLSLKLNNDDNLVVVPKPHSQENSVKHIEIINKPDCPGNGILSKSILQESLSSATCVNPFLNTSGNEIKSNIILNENPFATNLPSVLTNSHGTRVSENPFLQSSLDLNKKESPFKPDLIPKIINLNNISANEATCKKDPTTEVENKSISNELKKDIKSKIDETSKVVEKLKSDKEKGIESQSDKTNKSNTSPRKNIDIQDKKQNELHNEQNTTVNQGQIENIQPPQQQKRMTMNQVKQEIEEFGDLIDKIEKYIFDNFKIKVSEFYYDHLYPEDVSFKLIDEYFKDKKFNDL